MEFYLAQINIAKMLAPIDSPVMADFVANLDSINALAETSEGFVWRLKDESNNATAIKIFDDDFFNCKYVGLEKYRSIVSICL